MTIGENIRKLRKEKKFTQQRLAKEIGISRSYLSDIENNRYNPSSKTLEMFAEKLNVSMLYLTTGKKTLNDLNDDELKEQFESVSARIKSDNDRISYLVKNKLKELSESELEYRESLYLQHALLFLSQSNEEDIKRLTALIIQLIKYKDVGEDENINQRQLLNFIEGETKIFKEFLKQRFKYKEGE